MIYRSFPHITLKSVLARLAYCQKPCWLSYSLCDNFNLYSSDRSLCPLCLCGSFHDRTVRNLNCLLRRGKRQEAKGNSKAIGGR
ncbi:MAG: hypothetical protein EWV64_00670 [Microcystis flos-aquae Ma_QC_C_20070823_S18]|uniref:Uncharacterized protein n=1 Tax=Microcystis flos-aquae Mf_QC_C_20070823_S10D TaxID=2486236 RepID=A0A552KNL3_9CHRO|nr:MAG: hypothetical protein EWV64_00670 [Microcystis flos-aquae Ma_QC_C_20070823_S18]TRT95906.1 MAG: hypothetical protein EWV65_14560 [Microcystis flos-aquae Ma_QC_C_20070823_S18D]TRU67439.1 MAG: hypothetical protein EWV90_00505 [Microcystis aeruginosa Ma_QC_Ch_20071001_M135]TRV09583.1 MAG: hypothetical protein EWV45_15405 [Microcystis flos-aquae Mf_QC_C_20070823_S10D]TRV21932.1 MAG: hypothetical protein EWV72_16410 [Microcystis flos-aquae Mf_QC_C_20070823_S10]TRV31814.1 MAG: hypothetical pro